MRFLIVTGVSGAGKSQALKMLEDIGYFCADNLPTVLLGQFIDLCVDAASCIQNAAVVVDLRSGLLFDTTAVLKELRRNHPEGVTTELLFLDCSDESLIMRYKETRREHPLAKNSSLIEAINHERDTLQLLKEAATHLIETSNLSGTRTLKSTINQLFGENEATSSLRIEIVSFGFKRGMPRDADFVFDVRFMPNPYYIPSLKSHSGKENDVREFVLSNSDSTGFLDKLSDMMLFLLPPMIQEGRKRLLIAIGCTGGMHRSVTIAEELGKALSAAGYKPNIIHRDIEVEKNR